MPRLYVLLGSSGADGILNDVSEGGLALDIVGSQAPGEFVDVDFEMPELGSHFEAKGRVTWRDEANKRVGVSFVDMPEAARAQIRQWLEMKAASGHALQPTVVLDADREATSTTPPERKQDVPTEPGVGTSPTESQVRPTATPPVESPDEAGTETASQTDPGSPPKKKDDRLVQNLIDSFNAPAKKPDNKNADLIATWKQHSSGWNTDADFFSSWGYRRWVVMGALAGVAVLLAIGVAAHRLPWGNAASISVSKAGQSPNSSSSPGAQNSQTQTPANIAGAGDSGSPTRNETRSGQGADDATTASPDSETSAPSFPPALSAASPKAGQAPCINLGPNSGKIRIYLWSEKDTPQAIIATYARNLRAVQDVELVEKAPYDLVLYVNGAQVKPSGAEAGFMWSSRVFRPWYCGQSLGLLEQTQVNESLHYVQGANLDQRIQAEIAYLILHTFESIRAEHQK